MQDSKTLLSIDVTLLGKAKLVKLVQNLKAPFPIDATLSGIIMLFKLPHS